MTDAPRCRYNLDSHCPTDGLLDRIAALEVAARSYRERAERAETQNRAAWAVARDMVSDCEAGYADPMEVRPYAQAILRVLGLAQNHAPDATETGLGATNGPDWHSDPTQPPNGPQNAETEQ